MPQGGDHLSHSSAGVSPAGDPDARGGPARHPAGQPVREGAHSQCQAEHRAHPDLPVGCRARGGGDLQDRQGQARSRAGICRRPVERDALMAIVPLVKVTLCGPAAEKGAALDGLQSLGCLHLNDLRAGAAAVELEPSSPDARQALQYLWDSPVRRPALRQKDNVDVQALVKDALDIRDRSRARTEEREQLHKWIADVEPWGDFELPEWATKGDLRFWFYIVPLHQMRGLDAITRPWRVVARDHRLAYVVVVAAEQPTNMPVAPAPFEPRSLAKLRKRLEQVERELEELDYRRIGLTLYVDVLREALDEADDRAARQQAAGWT